MVRSPIVLCMLAVTALLAASAAVGDTRAGSPDSTLALPDPATRAWQLGLARPDRLRHLSLSFTIGLGVGLIARRASAAAASGLACGLAKELYDIRHSGFDVLDLAADVIGAGAATAITAGVLD